MRLAHCSDLHLLSLDGARFLDFASKRWIGGLNLLTNRARHYQSAAFDAMIDDFNRGGVDHVLCTGDLTNVALENEFRNALGYFERIKLGPTGITVIPGNHDAYVQEGAEFFSSIFGAYFAPDQGWASADGDPWPIVRIRDGVAIIGLSTSLQTPWFTAYGRLGEKQLERFAEVLADPRLAGLFRVVAIHHPPAGRHAASRIRGLKDREAFAQVLAAHGADLVLHGHEHQDLHHELPIPAGRTVPVRGIQSGTYAHDRPERTARYRIYEIEGGKVVSETLRIFDVAQGAFTRDPSPPAWAVTVS